MRVRRINNVVCMILLGSRYEEVYDGRNAGFYVCVCAEVSSYVDLYEDVDIYDEYEVGFL